MVEERRSGVRKDDQGKPRMDLLVAEFLLDMGRLADFGAKKYEENGWRGLTVQRMYGALMRHALQFESGEDMDEETALSHMVAVAFNAMCCAWLAANRPQQDDRWKEPEPDVF